METSGTSNFFIHLYILFQLTRGHNTIWFLPLFFLIPQDLETFVPNLDPDGVDLLSVSSLTIYIYSYIHTHILLLLH